MWQRTPLEGSKESGTSNKWSPGSPGCALKGVEGFFKVPRPQDHQKSQRGEERTKTKGQSFSEQTLSEPDTKLWEALGSTGPILTPMLQSLYQVLPRLSAPPLPNQAICLSSVLILQKGRALYKAGKGSFWLPFPGPSHAFQNCAEYILPVVYMLSEGQKVEMAFLDHTVTPWLNLATIQALASVLGTPCPHSCSPTLLPVT